MPTVSRATDNECPDIAVEAKRLKWCRLPYLF